MKNSYEIRGEVTVIFIKRNDGSVFKTFIDTVDLEKACSFPNSWRVKHDKATGQFYVQGNIQKGSVIGSISLHRWLMDDPCGYEVDHKDSNPLNNRRSCNLRKVTKAQNAQNRRGPQRNNGSSGVRGVTWHKVARKWMVQVKAGPKKLYGGVFEELETAERAAIALRKMHMPFSHERVVDS
ncbi:MULTISPECIES: HNH endonuclease [unclassified Paenibacillus]|nr:MULTISPECIES: HNH endonuclease [unclassified Paenibacillus]MDF9844182.1 hypothetical protein [Paenibacillus sp. PastF-2]MDF9850696.1 hypothetical protein [Paenibacillus sp. PastM-2]MDH6482625.1 hypothetical protein [Paenibacillus sp. PastH-2]MDH6510052.1 hypothetical protein [Paenibacillus sp. PastM-3]